MKTIQSNVKKLYLIRAMSSFMVVMPVIVLFFQENGLSLAQVFWLQTIFSVALLVFEVPSGYFADAIGGKKSIIIGLWLGFFGYCVYAVSGSFLSFAAAEILLALGVGFISGADSALVYESLKVNGQKREFKRIEGRRLSFGLYSEAAASLMGGFLALVSLRFPMFVEAGICLLTIPVGYSLMEPREGVSVGKRNPWKDFRLVFSGSMLGNGKLKWLIIYSAVVGSATLTMVWFIQPFWENAGLPLYFFGVFYAVLIMFCGLVSWNAEWIERKIGLRRLLKLLVLLPVAGYFLLGSFPVLLGTLVLIFFYFVRGVNNPVLNDEIHKIAPPKFRATILSVKNLIGRMIFSVVGPFVGWIGDVWSLPLALLMSGAIFLVFGGVSLVFLKKYKVV